MSKHKFDEKRWAQLTIFDQLGNVSAEVGRAFNAKKSGDKKRMEAAFYRGIDLLNVTIRSLAKQRSARLHEVLIAREQFCEAVLTDKDDEKLNDYFTQFAIAARMRHMA